MNTATARTFAPLTDHQTAALTAFAREYGPQWKARLADLWYRAAATPTLHALRNSHGHDWLDGFVMAQPARIVAGGRVVVERGCKALGLRKGHRLIVEIIDGTRVTLSADIDGIHRRNVPLAVEKAEDLGAMVTKLYHPDGVIEVRALGCEAPRE